MEVEEVDNHALDGVDHRLAVEVVVREFQPLLDVVEIERAHLLLLWGEPHDGVVEQGQVSLHAVVALRCTHLDELLRDVDGIHLEILALHDVACHVAAGENQAVARLKTKRLVAELKIAMPLAAIGVAQVARKPLVAEVGQGVFDDDVGADVHSGKITKIPQPKLSPELWILGALQAWGSMSKKIVNLQCRYLLVLFNGLRRRRMERRKNVKKESPLFI